MSADTVLQMVDIDKKFPGVHALDSLSFECRRGEVHILMGENGAGKSTLLKILSGIYKADSGTIFIDGEKVEIRNPNDAAKKGLAIIHQELSMCKNMTIAENIYRGREPLKKYLGTVDHAEMHKAAQKALEELGMNLSADTVVGQLSIAQQQMVEIAGALSTNARIIIMDEPTASLTEHEVDSLFTTINRLRENGVCIIYVSHRLNETFTIGDRVSVIRDGKYIGTKNVSETDSDTLIEMMVGRPLSDIYSGELPRGGEVVFEVKGFTNNKLNNVSFDLRRGEVLGFSGLVGAGRTELARAIFGLDKITSGSLILEGKEAQVRKPTDAVRHGIGLVPEDRKGAGLILMNTMGFNLTLAILHKFIRLVGVNHKKEKEIIDKYSQSLTIKSAGPDQKCATLSGGNQQKVVISKWLATNPKYLILDEPTRGIDVGAKAEIYALINRLAHEGISVIVISSDLPEIINLCSRVVVMHEGSVAGVLDAHEKPLTQVDIMKLATGGK